MGVLSIGSLAALFPTKCPAHPEGIARQPGRDIRADIEGHQEAEPRTCPPIVAMSGGGCSPTSSRGTCRSPGF